MWPASRTSSSNELTGFAANDAEKPLPERIMLRAQAALREAGLPELAILLVCDLDGSADELRVHAPRGGAHEALSNPNGLLACLLRAAACECGIDHPRIAVVAQ